MKGSFTKI